MELNIYRFYLYCTWDILLDWLDEVAQSTTKII